MQLVVLGRGDARYHQMLLELRREYPRQVGISLTQDEKLAHQIEAGADMFLMPSRFEPCGLTQMYSLRYGTVPIVRSTGGLVDTVEPYDPVTGNGTGFRFDMPDGTALIWALDQALDLWRDRAAWRRLMRNGMERDFSWDRSARCLPCRSGRSCRCWCRIL